MDEFILLFKHSGAGFKPRTGNKNPRQNASLP
jgi:hypothetical protein